jgi:hypothetical protein
MTRVVIWWVREDSWCWGDSDVVGVRCSVVAPGSVGVSAGEEVSTSVDAGAVEVPLVAKGVKKTSRVSMTIMVCRCFMILSIIWPDIYLPA